MQGLCLEKTYLGIEFGSTRIKAVLTDNTYKVVASGGYSWENSYSDGFWTYSAEEIHKGLQSCFSELSQNVYKSYGIKLTTVGAMGISAMMHGYMAFDSEENLLVPFRTWRNTTTSEAAKKLSELFEFHIPERWSIAHLYQAILNNEPHIDKISKLRTLAGYIHFRLSGRHEVGVGEASGMFPIANGRYNTKMLKSFEELTGTRLNKSMTDILPEIRFAGEHSAYLTEEGAKFLDPTGTFRAGVPIAPPEGDAGTGMVATNSVMPGTGNISAGTSVFSMLVLKQPLKGVYPEIDVVTTPDGADVAMVHCNNCCGELDNWVNLFYEFSSIAGIDIDKSAVYELLYKNTKNADNDCGGIRGVNYISGEHITGIEKGIPLVFRMPGGKSTLANFFKSQLCSAFATLKIGMDILLNSEKAAADRFFAHGGLFKVEGIAQSLLANALNTPVSVCETAGEGGAWGVALLAAYMINGGGLKLGEWLEKEVFGGMRFKVIEPGQNEALSFDNYMNGFKAGLMAEKKIEEVI